MRSIVDLYLGSFEHEMETTRKVLSAFPEDKLQFKPHPKSMSAVDLAWILVSELGLIEKALTTGFDWSKPMKPPGAPATMAEVIAALQKGAARVVELMKGLDDAALQGTVSFMVAPKTLGDVPKQRFVWIMLNDHIHHRGQFSVYLRMVDGKVPSIYGPSADEPWF